MKPIRLKNVVTLPKGIRSRAGARVVSPSDSSTPAKVRKRLVPCVFQDCGLGSIEERPDLSVVRVTPGYVVYRKFGPLFLETLRFPDGSKHKYAHAVCAYDAGFQIAELKMDRCCIPECGEQFYCMEKGKEEGCLLFQVGYFRSSKGGRIPIFTAEQHAAAHWACARWHYQWELFENMVDSVTKPGFRDVGTK